MKTQEEIVIQAKVYAESIGNEDGTSAYDYVMGYNQCQKDMARKEIQPEDIWNDEKLNMVKEHILNHIKNQTPANIAETELVAKKYAKEDMVKDFLLLIKEYKDKELPNCNKPFHHEAEISSGLDGLVNYIKNKQD